MPRTSAVDRVQDVYAASYRRLVGQLTGVTGDPVEAEDAVLEAFARAVNSPRSFLAAESPEAWLRTVAVNVTRTRWRRSRFFRDVRAEPPGFGAVLDRARAARRRRRTAVASGFAAAIVVGALAFAVGDPAVRSTDPAPSPTPPTPWDGTTDVDTRLPAGVRAILDDDRLDLWAASGSSGAVAVLWRGCDQEPCRFAVVTRDGEDVTGTTLGASFPRLAPVPGGWLVEDASGTFRLTPSGERTQIYVTGPGNADVTAGDTAVGTADGVRLLRGDKVIQVPSPAGQQTSSAYVTPDGQLVAISTGGVGIGISTTGDGRTWVSRFSIRYPEVIRSAVVAGHDDTVAVAFLGDDPDGSIPVVDVQVSHDAGATWIRARGLKGVRDLSSLAVTAGGTTYATTGSHGLVRMDAGGNALPTPVSSFDSSAFALDDSVCLVAEAGRVDQLWCSGDDGTSWAPAPLPGFS